MTQAFFEGVAATLQFDCNLLQALCLITIARPWFTKEVENNFLAVIEYIMDKMYQPLRILTRHINSKIDLAPYLFLGVLVPIQFFIMLKLRAS
jgi:uncharacterized protein YggT (Ycf19 family)